MTEKKGMGMVRVFAFCLICFATSLALADACYDPLGNPQPCAADDTVAATPNSAEEPVAAVNSPPPNQSADRPEPPRTPSGGGVLDGLDKSDTVNACNSVCTVNKVCDGACVKACEACSKSCDGKMCTKKSLTNFVCKDESDDEDKTEKNKPDAARAAAQRCLDDNSDAVSNCTSSQSSADNTCNADKNAGMGGATDLAAAMALALGQMTGSGIQAACGSMANISEGSNAALAAYRVSCNNSKNSCTTTCSSAKSKVDQCAKNSQNGSDVQRALADLDDYKSMTSAGSKCKALQTKVDQADQAIKNIGATMQNAANCQQATSAMANPAATPGQDCSNPTFAATNQVCICQANPRLAGCGGNDSTTVGNQGLGSTTDFSSATGGAGATDLPNLKDTNLAEFNAQKTASGEVGGRQGAGAPIGGGSTFGSGGGTAAKAAGTDYAKYGGGSGFYNGASGGGGGGAGSGAGRAGAAAVPANAGFYGKEQRPDLRQFLPGGKADPSRGVAGTTGPDGITGPNTNIWEKVQNRYRSISPSLF